MRYPSSIGILSLSDIIIYMKYRKPFIAASIIVFVAAGIALVIANKKPVEAPTEQQGSQIELPANTNPITMQPEMISIAEDSYLLGISGFYPKFTQADSIFNKKIEDFIKLGVASFKKEANDNYKARLETGGEDFQKEFSKGEAYTYQIKTDIIQSNKDFISITITVAGYSGGAHGYETTTSFNYDVKGNKEIELGYFYPNNSDYLKIISELARKQLEPKLIKASEQSALDENMKSMLADGTDPKNKENFKTFTFTHDTLTIYFGQYQVAPYVYGQQTIDIQR